MNSTASTAMAKVLIDAWVIDHSHWLNCIVKIWTEFKIRMPHVTSTQLSSLSRTRID
ncbi:hypothetical protein ACIN8IBEIGE_20024 [Acinetobacter sp. 8I-beige]|nr:hypothetical protein ACIN8IBEIGE_20024 [Acinetobacter sp. 8I-beige]